MLTCEDDRQVPTANSAEAPCVKLANYEKSNKIRIWWSDFIMETSQYKEMIKK